MGWFQTPFGSPRPTDGGAIYDRVEGGKPIPLDDEERESIETALESEQRSLQGIVDSVERDGRLLPEGVRRTILADADLSVVVSALKQLAYQRYLEGEYQSAANSCIRALGFAAQTKETNFYEPELWHILARIHATVGRFETAKTLLDRAEKRAKQVGVLERSPEGLRSGWFEGAQSLRDDIRRQRHPRPSMSIYLPSSIAGWLEPE